MDTRGLGIPDAWPPLPVGPTPDLNRLAVGNKPYFRHEMVIENTFVAVFCVAGWCFTLIFLSTTFMLKV